MGEISIIGEISAIFSRKFVLFRKKSSSERGKSRWGLGAGLFRSTNEFFPFFGFSMRGEWVTFPPGKFGVYFLHAKSGGFSANIYAEIV